MASVDRASRSRCSTTCGSIGPGALLGAIPAAGYLLTPASRAFSSTFYTLVRIFENNKHIVTHDLADVLSAFHVINLFF
jgi:hypothetical protein